MSTLDEWIKSLKKIQMIPEMDSNSKEKGVEIKCTINKTLKKKRTISSFFMLCKCKPLVKLKWKLNKR